MGRNDFYSREERKAYNKAYRAKNKEVLAAMPDRLSKEGRRKYNESDRLRRYYGIDLEEYNKIFAKQFGCCAICLKHQASFNKRLSVDHNHETGQIRGLLCFHCNTGLGHFKDQPGVLISAINYLKQTPDANIEK